MTRRTLAKRVAIAGLVLAAGAQAIRPARLNPSIDPARTMEQILPVPSHIQTIVDRACIDCHSNRTRWPWYSNVAPVSWVVIDHVNHGRTHLNLSDWRRFSTAEADRMLARMCEEVSSGAMPMASYLLLHRESTLSSADVERLCAWSREAQAYLAARPPAPGS